MTDTATVLDARNAVRELSSDDITKLMGWLIVRHAGAVVDAIDAMQAYDARPKPTWVPDSVKYQHPSAGPAVNWRLIRFIIAHPLIAHRHHRAVNAPWPEMVQQ